MAAPRFPFLALQRCGVLTCPVLESELPLSGHGAAWLERKDLISRFRELLSRVPIVALLCQPLQKRNIFPEKKSFVTPVTWAREHSRGRGDESFEQRVSESHELSATVVCTVVHDPCFRDDRIEAVPSQGRLMVRENSVHISLPPRF